jgi:phosphohistidine phosphatase SixA
MKMNLRRLALPACALVLVSAIAASRQESTPSSRDTTTTILVVRHADRVPNQDALTPAGVARAKELVHLTARSGLAGLYCSPTARARQTIEPVAQALGLTPVEHDPADSEGLIRKILADHRGKAVLVVGHSNTVPKVVAAGGGPALADLRDDDFDDLYVLTIGGTTPADVRLTTLQYGAATP